MCIILQLQKFQLQLEHLFNQIFSDKTKQQYNLCLWELSICKLLTFTCTRLKILEQNYLLKKQYYADNKIYYLLF